MYQEDLPEWPEREELLKRMDRWRSAEIAIAVALSVIALGTFLAVVLSR